MANPPFNVDRIDKERLKDDERFPLGLPRVDNGNYIWIQIFYSSLADGGRAGFVMANSAAEARVSEQELRRKLIQAGVIDVIVAISSNFFYTVSLPVTLWFLDNGKKTTDRADKALFIDARHVFRQLDRAHRDFAPEQAEFVANIARLYRGESPEFVEGSEELTRESFPDLLYRDVVGLCRVATVVEIEAQDWSLTTGRYIGVADRPADGIAFEVRLEELNEQLEILNAESRTVEERIADNVAKLLTSSR